MIEVSTNEFIKNPAYIQALAEKEPVLVDDGNKKQVLINYDDFVKLEQPKPFVSLYEVFANVPEELRQELLLLDDDIEEDFSFAHRD